MIVTVLISKWLAGPRPLSAFIMSIPLRIAGILAFVLLFISTAPAEAIDLLSPTPTDDGNHGGLLIGFVLITVLYRVPCQINFTAQMAFFAKVSDPSIGGTYMTLLNTLSNLGTMIASQVALRTVDGFAAFTPPHAMIDGFVIVSVLAATYGGVWMYWLKDKVLALEAAPMSEWSIKST